MLQPSYDNQLHQKVLHQGINEILNCLREDYMLLLGGFTSLLPPPLHLLQAMPEECALLLRG